MCCVIGHMYLEEPSYRGEQNGSTNGEKVKIKYTGEIPFTDGESKCILWWDV